MTFKTATVRFIFTLLVDSNAATAELNLGEFGSAAWQLLPVVTIEKKSTTLPSIVNLGRKERFGPDRSRGEDADKRNKTSCESTGKTWRFLIDLSVSQSGESPLIESKTWLLLNILERGTVS